MKPMYKRMQGEPRRVLSEEQVQEMYQHYGITHGTLGSADEHQIREMLDSIVHSHLSKDSRLDALEALHWYTVNNVENGGVSDVLEEVDSATRIVLYENNSTN